MSSSTPRSWTAQRVLDAAITMDWRPDGAIEAPAGDYRLRALASGPILLRSGFADYGEARCYWLPVTAAP